MQKRRNHLLISSMDKKSIAIAWFLRGIAQTTQKVMRIIKGESAFWFNKQGLTNQKLEWQDEYFAVSVSDPIAIGSQIDTVRNCMKNQEELHKY